MALRVLDAVRETTSAADGRSQVRGGESKRGAGGGPQQVSGLGAPHCNGASPEPSPGGGGAGCAWERPRGAASSRTPRSEQSSVHDGREGRVVGKMRDRSTLRASRTLVMGVGFYGRR